MGSDSDLPIMKDAAEVLKTFDVPFEVSLFWIQYLLPSFLPSQGHLTFTSGVNSIFVTFFQITIVSAHRTPERMYSYALSAKNRGIHAIIAGAGGAAHLPGYLDPSRIQIAASPSPFFVPN